MKDNDPVPNNNCPSHSVPFNSIHQAAEAARRDNVALYEKIRYLQSYGYDYEYEWHGRAWRGGCFCFPDFLPSFHFSPSFARTPQHHTTSSSKASSSAAAMEAGAAPPNTAAAEARYRAVYDEQVRTQSSG